MTELSRKEKLEQMLEQDPDDQFLRYGLAMELDKEGENDRSLEIFATLTKDDPPHVGAFFMAGQQLAKLGRTGEAQVILKEGIEQADAQGNSHASGEMTFFLQNLGDD